MREVIYTCDHCGKRIPADSAWPEPPLQIAHTDYVADLCEDCWKELQTLVTDFIGVKLTLYTSKEQGENAYL